jgi:hypothetical protein
MDFLVLMWWLWVEVRRWGYGGEVLRCGGVGFGVESVWLMLCAFSFS